jgi:hypothetical protein
VKEHNWLVCNDPLPMFAWLRKWRRKRPLARKLRLFACACCRRVWETTAPADATRNGVEVAERFADGLLSIVELIEARRTIPMEREFMMVNWAMWAPSLSPDMAAASAARYAEWTVGSENERRVQAILLRDIMGNPFRPVVIDPRWLTSTVVDLARLIYEERCFDRLPILADALMDAGCDDDEMLIHCRGDGLHARGCWAVDLILGKA